MRELTFRSLRITIRVYGQIHANLRVGYPSVPPDEKSDSPRNVHFFSPEKFLVETSPRSLDVSNFIWESRNSEIAPEEVFASEYACVDTPAIVGAIRLGLNPRTTVFPIDVDSAVTRRRLAMSLLLHPWESLVLISRYYGKSYPSATDSESISLWRREFQAACPTAFRILFTERELYMVSEIQRHVTASPPNTRIAVYVGLSHIDAICDQLVLQCQ